MSSVGSKPREYSKNRTKVWEVLCKGFFNKYIPADSKLVDIGAGNCNFINSIQVKEKVAVDKDPSFVSNTNNGTKTYVAQAPFLNILDNSNFDIVFSSNMIEHLEDKNEVKVFIEELCRICKPDGKCILMFPNIRYTKEFWDCFDHKVPLSDKAIVELVKTMPFKVVKAISQFLPYQMGDSTSKTIKLPFIGWLVWLYLKVPLLWKVFGKQCVVILEKCE